MHRRCFHSPEARGSSGLLGTPGSASPPSRHTPEPLSASAHGSPAVCFRQDVVLYCSSNRFHISPSEQDSAPEWTGRHADSRATWAALLMQQVRASLKGKSTHFPIVAFRSIEASPNLPKCPGVSKGGRGSTQCQCGAQGWLCALNVTKC